METATRKLMQQEAAETTVGVTWQRPLSENAKMNRGLTFFAQMETASVTRYGEVVLATHHSVQSHLQTEFANTLSKTVTNYYTSAKGVQDGITFRS